MSEGELKKRIREKWIPNGITIREMEDILDEAKKEFPVKDLMKTSLCEYHYKGHPTEKDFLDWFMKWFGE